jgi:hemolysin activation/secretion protein
MHFLGARSVALATLALGAGAAGGQALAQDVPGTVEPGAIGQEFQAVPERYSDSPVSVPTASGPVAPAGADQQMFVLNALSVEGVTAFPAAEIDALYAGRVGSEISLATLFGIAQDITKHYSDNGYPLSVAFVPAQEIEGGAARIKVHEGYVAEVEITGDAGGARSELEIFANQLIGERPLSARTLERYLLLANDLPGIRVQAVIDRASAEPGAIKVIFAVERDLGNAAITLSNRGSKALGPYRIQAAAALNNVLQGGDRLRADMVLAPEDNELGFFSAGYEFPIGVDGFRLGLVGSWTDADPGTELLQALAFSSDGWTAGVEASYPILRTRGRNLILGGGIEYNQFESRFDDVVNSHDVLWIARANLAFDAMGPSGAVNSLFVQVSQGLGFATTTERGHPLASRARGSAEFTSLLVDAGRVQPVSGPLELALSSRVQVAGRKLLASEECGYGGAGVGRAFDNFEIAGDHCFMASAELRRQPEMLFGEVTAAPYGFFDVGQVWTHGAAAPGQLDDDQAQSIGGGVRLGLGESLSAYLEYAKPISHDVALEGDDTGRVFFGLTARR